LDELIKSLRKDEKKIFLDEIIKLRWSLELFKGLAYVHSKNVVHRDLKPSNVFLYEKEKNKISIKIGDFGLGKDCSYLSCLKSFAGTFYYQSPQIIRGEAHTFKTDVW